MAVAGHGAGPRHDRLGPRRRAAWCRGEPATPGRARGGAPRAGGERLPSRAGRHRDSTPNRGTATRGWRCRGCRIRRRARSPPVSGRTRSSPGHQASGPSSPAPANAVSPSVGRSRCSIRPDYSAGRCITTHDVVAWGDMAPRSRSASGLGRSNEPPVLILTSLAGGPKHGYTLTKDIATFAKVRLGPGSLYGALARLEERGLIEPEPLGPDADSRRRPYRITGEGRAALESAVRGDARPLGRGCRSTRHRRRDAAPAPGSARMTRTRRSATTGSYERMLRWYPPAWQARYGDEMTALMEDSYESPRHVPARDRLNLFRSGLAERARAIGIDGSRARRPTACVTGPSSSCAVGACSSSPAAGSGSSPTSGKRERRSRRGGWLRRDSTPLSSWASPAAPSWWLRPSCSGRRWPGSSGTADGNGFGARSSAPSLR